jgi:hypothetical protein
LLRWRYMAAASAMETNGVPIDVPTLEMLRAHWTDIKEQLITDIDAAICHASSFVSRLATVRSLPD